MTSHSLKIPSNQKFGILFSVVSSFGIFYFWNEYKYICSAFIFLTFFFVGVTIFFPSILTPLNRAWFGLSLFLGKVVSPIVLSIIFFVLIVPVAFITRLFGRDALSLKKRQVSSYWVDKEPIEPDSFKNQF